MENNNSCQCDKCKGACNYAPGWFMPEQIEPLAKAMGLTTQELFDMHLRVDYWGKAAWRGDESSVFLLGPNVTHGRAGGMAAFDPRGRCVLLKDGKCTIHELGKPHECALYIHGMSNDEVYTNHESVARAWDKPEHQAFIRDLLGREPVAAEPENVMSMLGMF